MVRTSWTREHVTELALGTAQLTGPYGVAFRPGEQGGPHVLREAHARGIAWVDTSPQYGTAEACIGEFHRTSTARFRVCSKLPRLPQGLSSHALADHVRQHAERSRAELAVDVLDAYLIHSASDLSDYGTALVDALCSVRDAGVIERIGISVYDAGEARLALDSPELRAIQYPFNLFDRRFRDDGIVSSFRARDGITFARSPLLQGVLALSVDALPPHVALARGFVRELRALCSDYAADPVSVALGFALSRSGADFVVLGMEDASQVRAASCLEMPPVALLDAAELIARDAPRELVDPRRWSRA